MQQYRKLVTKVALLILVTTGLLNISGCILGVAAGGATGGAVGSDNRDLGQQTTDQSLQQKVGNLVYKDPDIHDNAQVVIAVYDNDVLLAGQARTQAVRAKVEKKAYAVKGVKRVYNEMVIGEPIGGWTQTHDAWLTTKVKSQLAVTANLRSSHVKVVTDNSIVYLIGRLNQQQADLAVQAASQVDSVQKVVTSFRDPSTDKAITVKPVAKKPQKKPDPLV